MTRILVPPGVNSLPRAQVPKKWDPEWFVTFMQTWLGPSDIRNGTGVGISITGSGKTPPTIKTIGYTGSVTISGTTLTFVNGLLINVAP